MQSPREEIERVFTLLTQAHTATIQADALTRFYTSDAAFRHPLCIVPSAPGSRKEILGIYQWYRIMSPKLQGDVKAISYDEENGVIYLEAVQKFHIFISPLPVHPARLIVRMKLRKEGDLWYICEQEDFYHPEDIMALVIPPLIWPARIALRFGSISSNILAKGAQIVFGWWR